jgi:hypothetical protein
MNSVFNKTRSAATYIAVMAAAGLALCSHAEAQNRPTYSVDIQCDSVPGLNDPGHIYTPQGTGQISPPATVIPSFMLGINNAGTLSELDALSYGTEPLLQKTLGYQHRWSFSVDEFAVGRAGVPGPSVTTEGAFSPFPEAAGDIYVSNLAPGPMAPFAGVNTGLYDGNGGLTPFAAPGLNLREPTPPTVGNIDVGDNLDAWDLDESVPVPVQGTVYPKKVYFSLDSHFTDPLEAPLAINTGSAIANGFVSGDVLISSVNGNPPTVFAPAAMLGLDQLGPDTDDLDALVLWDDNNDGIYDPTMGPYSWAGGLTDMLLFSVRRGSAVIGQTDSILGLPIEEGDILVPMGTPGALPGIFVPAEALGLATKRTNPAATFQGFGDDLDALDVQQVVPEPTSALLLLLGLCGLLSRRRVR